MAERCDLGHAYDKGEEVTKDFNKAAHFYKKACDGGLNEECVNLMFIKHVKE